MFLKGLGVSSYAFANVKIMTIFCLSLPSKMLQFWRGGALLVASMATQITVLLWFYNGFRGLAPQNRVFTADL